MMYRARIPRDRPDQVFVHELSDTEEIVVAGVAIIRKRPIFAELTKHCAVAQDVKPQYAIANAKVLIEENLLQQKGKTMRKP